MGLGVFSTSGYSLSHINESPRDFVVFEMKSYVPNIALTQDTYSIRPMDDQNLELTISIGSAPKRDFFELYKRINRSKLFQKVHQSKSLGDFIEIVD